MKLSVEAGFGDGNAFDLCFGGTINALMAMANTALQAYPITTAAGLNRTTQEHMKNCLDALNNGGLVGPPATSCSAPDITPTPLTPKSAHHRRHARGSYKLP